MLALVMINSLALFHIFIEKDEILLYTYLGLFFIFVSCSTLAAIGAYAFKAELIVPLLYWFSLHVVILGGIDAFNYARGKLVLDQADERTRKSRLIGDIIIDIVAYTSYIYFLMAFCSLYVETKEKQLQDIDDDDDEYI